MPEYVWGWIRDVVMAVVTVLVFFWGRDRKQTADLIDVRFKSLVSEMAAEFNLRDQRFSEMRKDVDELHRRMDQAGDKSSDLASVVQATIGRLDRLPEELRTKFMSLDRGLDMMEEARQDRKALWEIIDRLAKGGPRG